MAVGAGHGCCRDEDEDEDAAAASAPPPLPLPVLFPREAVGGYLCWESPVPMAKPSLAPLGVCVRGGVCRFSR